MESRLTDACCSMAEHLATGGGALPLSPLTAGGDAWYTREVLAAVRVCARRIAHRHGVFGEIVVAALLREPTLFLATRVDGVPVAAHLVDALGPTLLQHRRTTRALLPLVRATLNDAPALLAAVDARVAVV